MIRVRGTREMSGRGVSVSRVSSAHSSSLFLTSLSASTERDSYKNQTVVSLYVFAILGLLIWAFLRPRLTDFAQVRAAVCAKSGRSDSSHKVSFFDRPTEKKDLLGSTRLSRPRHGLRIGDERS
jgi:hypothetical protein